MGYVYSTSRSKKFAPRNYSFRGRRGRFGGVPLSENRLIAKADETPEASIYVDNHSYSEFGLSDVIIRNIAEKGYTNLTKIQFSAIPEIINNRDIIGVASTGSGKTAAFLIPLVDRMFKAGRGTCLIVVPTRELAMQIQDEFRWIAKNTGLKSVLIMGGNSANTQIGILRRNPQFIVGTPGRLMDLERRGVLHLKNVNYVVLDEVDRMLDMGFIVDIKKIISMLNPERQSMFFSATMNNKTEMVANTLLKNPIKLEVEKQVSGKNVDQDVVRVSKTENKVDVLLKLLSKEELSRVLIFTATKRGAENLSRRLQEHGIEADALHGDKKQNQRTRIIEKFKLGRLKVLIATDVASRGIDVNNISHVINYDMPKTYDDYTHRIGRTGRAGKKGYALTFVDGK